MSRRFPVNISVCMATYNGMKYLEKQLDSIISQLVSGDELIVVDDCSVDATIDILKKYEGIVNLKLVRNSSNMGVNASFEVALKLAKNEIVFMSDQDDIWTDDRVDYMCDSLMNSKALLVAGNSKYIDENDDVLEFNGCPLLHLDSSARIKNLIKIFCGTAGYYGCAMAFNRKLLKVVLPFPNFVESHDLWIAQAAILNKCCVHVDEIVLERRVHGNNASIIKRSFIRKVYSRIVFMLSIFIIAFR